MIKAIREIVRDHFVYRKQVIKMAKADLVKTYRGAALGWAWALIRPAVMIFVYWFAFSFGLRRGGDVNGYPFFLWLLCGMIPWFYMRDMLTQGTECIKKYRYLVTKMKYPVSTIPSFVSLSKVLINAILMVAVIVIFGCFGYAPTIYLLQLPVIYLMMVLFFTLWALFASPIATISQDFSNLVKSFITAVFWLSGILYDPDTISNVWFRRILEWNPITYLCKSFRNCFVYQKWFFEDLRLLWHFGVMLLVMLLLALWSYRRLRKEMPDVL